MIGGSQEQEKKKPMLDRRARRTLTAYLFILPVLVLLAVFVFGPVLFTFFISFFKWDFFTPPVFVGISQYVELFTQDQAFKTALYNNIWYTILEVSMTIGIALLLALGITERSNVLRVVYFTPVITSTVASALIWKYMYEPHYGLINYVLDFFTLPTSSWLLDPRTSLLSIALMDVWKGCGFYMMILLAGLKAIPSIYYDAARTDGASTWQQFKWVTIPLLKPTLLFVLIMSALGSFQVFTPVYMLTAGGPAFSSTTITFLIYKYAFNYFSMGRACAASVILTIIVLAISVFQMRMLREGGMMEY